MKYFQLLYKVGTRCITVSQDLHTTYSLAETARPEFENRVMAEHPAAQYNGQQAGKAEIIEVTVKA